MLGLLLLVILIIGVCWLDLHNMEPKRVNKQAIINSEIDAKKRIKAKQLHVTEPYDDPHFITNPLNFDLDGFWDSYKKKYDK